MDKYIANYLRLSKDDNSIEESNSISSQRQIIENFIKSSPTLSDMPLVEFSDDGYSGTNFDRPGITKLLNAVKKGEVACIIVKDFSRFGRQYLEVSKLIEQIFPYFGIRFISVNDHYDSDNHKGTTAEIDVPIKNMINAMYSKDISKKIKSSVRTKKQQGILLNSISIFGYKIDDQKERKTVIDEPAAEIVRRIFMLADSGLSSFQIAENLNGDNIITPAAYKRQSGCKLVFKTSHRELWTIAMVSNILRDERYTGTFIGSVRESIKLGSGKKKRKPKDAWIRKPNTHTAIIESDLFNAITIKRKKHNVANERANTGRALYKRVICGHCEHVMRYKNTKSSKRYVCETAKYTGRFGCTKDSIYEQDILDSVKSAVSQQIKILLGIKKLCRAEKKSINKSINFTKSAIVRLENDIKKLQIAKRNLYEQYKKSEINKQTYISQRETLEAEITSKVSERDISPSENDNQAVTYNSAQMFFQSFLKYKGLSELNNDMINELITAVYFYSKDCIEIKFSFKDEMEQALRKGFVKL